MIFPLPLVKNLNSLAWNSFKEFIKILIPSRCYRTISGPLAVASLLTTQPAAILGYHGSLKFGMSLHTLFTPMEIFFLHCSEYDMPSASFGIPSESPPRLINYFCYAFTLLCLHFHYRIYLIGL